MPVKFSNQPTGMCERRYVGEAYFLINFKVHIVYLIPGPSEALGTTLPSPSKDSFRTMRSMSAAAPPQYPWGRPVAWRGNGEESPRG